MPKAPFILSAAAALALALAACGAPAPQQAPTPSRSPAPASQPAASPPVVGPQYDVREFGAAGDGRRDDTAALVAAAERAAAAGNGTVYLPAGTYLLPGREGFDLPDGVGLRGDGAATSWLKGRLNFGSRSTVAAVKIGARGVCAVRNRQAENTRFVACRFRGGGGEGDNAPVLMLGNGYSTAHGLHHVTFERCDVERNLGTEDWGVNSGYGHGYNNITVHENPARRGSHVAYLTFAGCRVGVSNGSGGRDTGGPRAGIEVWTAPASSPAQGWEHLVIRDSTFEATDRFCIDLADRETSSGAHLAGPALIEHNVIKGGGWGPGGRDWAYSICLEAPHDVTIRDNLIWRGRLTTICGSGAREGGTVIEGNTIDLSVPNGVTMTGDEVVVLKGGGGAFIDNVVIAGVNAGPLVYLKETSGQTVRGNRFYDHRSGGAPPMMLLRDASHNTITDNLFWTAAPVPPVISVTGASSGNRVSGNRFVHQ